jgi:oligopeptide/dipeptide ABC transporter ATP-binding protein
MALLIEVRNLQKYFLLKSGFFSRRKEYAKAVDGISFGINKGEILGLAGESGCGKTTAGRLMLRLIEPDDGSVLLMGQNLLNLPKKERKFRRDVQIIFQNAFASLNPRKTIRYIISRPLLLHNICDGNEVEDRISDLLSRVELTPPEAFMDRYPHELSGGQRQRIAIARAISVAPKFIVADEPVSALDVSTRGQILSLIKGLKEERDIAFLFITHDLAVLRSIAQRVAIMYLGRIVEIANAEDIFSHYRHPYTEALLHATPIPDPKLSRNRKRIILKGEVPSNINPPSGCHFHPRCLYAKPNCSEDSPELIESGDGSFVACHYPFSR